MATETTVQESIRLALNLREGEWRTGYMGEAIDVKAIARIAAEVKCPGPHLVPADPHVQIGDYCDQDGEKWPCRVVRVRAEENYRARGGR